LDVSTLEGWLWDAACQVRGPLDAPKFKDYILPLIFLKRLSDVFEDEFGRLVKDIGDEAVALEVVEGDRKAVRFYIPQKARWPQIRQRTTGLGEYLTDAVRAVAREAYPLPIFGTKPGIPYPLGCAVYDSVDIAHFFSFSRWCG